MSPPNSAHLRSSSETVALAVDTNLCKRMKRKGAQLRIQAVEKKTQSVESAYVPILLLIQSAVKYSSVNDLSDNANKNYV